MEMVFEKLVQTLGNGQLWRLNIAGNFFRLASAEWPVTLRVIKGGRIVGQIVDMQPGDYLRDAEFDAVEIKNGSIVQDVTVQIAGGAFGSDRVTGEVSVINGELGRVKSGQVFMGVSACSAMAGNYSHCQIYNPTGSGKKIILNKCSIVSSGIGLLSVSTSIGQLTALNGNAISKNVGSSAASIARLKVQNAASILGNIMGTFSSPVAYSCNEFSFSEPVLLQEGWGFIVGQNIPNENMWATFQWIEE